MKKRPVKIIAGIVFFILSLLLFFAKEIGIELLSNGIFIGVIDALLGVLFIYVFYEIENRTYKAYAISAGALLVLLGLMPMVLALNLEVSSRMLVLDVPAALGKILILFGSGFLLVDSFWKQ